jgi:hypothetical protein
MSNKRNKHNISGGFKGNTPPMKVENTFDVEGNFLGSRRVDQVRGNGIYHPTKGFRVIRKHHQHHLLNSLLAKIGMQGVY